MTPARDEPMRHDRLFDAPPPRVRPSEQFEPWPLAQETARELAEAAASRGLPLEMAGSLLIERALLEEDFAARGLRPLTVALDDLAARAEVESELSEAQSAYLRVLSHGRSKRTVELPLLLPVPMRLIERIGHEGLVRRLDPALLEAAILWERAAVISGRTMSEWAALALLEIAL